MDKIVTCLCYDRRAEEAATFYITLLPDSRIDRINRSTVDWPNGKVGDVLTVEFTLAGRSYVALNAGADFGFSPGISFQIMTDDQAETDRLWDALLADGGKPVQCSWLTDKYGMSWQVVPRRLIEMIADPDRPAATLAMEAMMRMVKIDIATLEHAFASGRSSTVVAQAQ